MALVAITVVACSKPATEQAAPAVAPAASAPAPGGAFEVTLKTGPEPAKMGANIFEAMVMQGDKPVDDATVSVEIQMPAMPSMNMAEMKTNAELKAAGNGVYRGTGQVMMAGNWNVTVMAMRNGQELATKKMTLTAK
jgi:uncharacterized GH25 family protein